MEIPRDDTDGCIDYLALPWMPLKTTGYFFGHRLAPLQGCGTGAHALRGIKALQPQASGHDNQGAGCQETVPSPGRGIKRGTRRGSLYFNASLPQSHKTRSTTRHNSCERSQS